MVSILIHEKSHPKRMGLFQCAPDGARFLWVKVPNPPGSGKDIAKGKGAHREVESEGSWMQKQTNRRPVFTFGSGTNTVLGL